MRATAPLRHRGAALLAALAVGLAVPTAARADEAHDRIAAERAAADARLADAERACARRFFASSCLDAARTEHRGALARLNDEALAVDAAARRAAAEARLRELEAKAARRGGAAGGRSPDPALESTAAPARAAASPPARLFPATSSLPGPKGPTGASRVALERQHEAAFAARAAEAASHRARVEQRNAAQAASGKAAAPLPPP